MFRSLGRSVPNPVWLILVLHLLVVLCQTAVFPNFRSPDERTHVDLIVAVAQGRAWPWPDPGTIAISRGSGAGGFTRTERIPGQLHLADRDPPPRGERPSYLTAHGDEPSRYPNQLIQHPPLYYLAGAAVLAVYPDWENAPFDRVFLMLRLWNVLLTAAVPFLLWATARRLALPEPVPIAVALVPLAVPEFTHTASSVNNDNLLVVLAALLTLLVARVLTGDTSRRTAIVIGGVATLALLTKGFALMIPAWVVLAYLVAVFRFRRPAALVSLVVAGLVMIPGLAWWVRNVLVYGTPQPDGSVTDSPDLTARFGWSDGGPGWLVRFVERLITLFFVHDQTGQRLHHWPWRMAFVAAALVLVGVVAVLALRVLPRMDTVVLLAPLVGLLAIVGMGSWELFAATKLYGGMQGRYLYGGLAGVGVVAVAATARLPARVRRFVPLALLGFVAAIQVVYLIYTLELFWVPSASSRWEALQQAIGAIYYWYPLPSALLGVIMGATAISGVAVVAALARVARCSPDGVSAPPTEGRTQGAEVRPALP